jgi:hypothetical protein
VTHRLAILSAAGLALVAAATGCNRLPPDLPPDYEQLLRRGAIPAIDKPKFRPAAEVDVPADAWVLGVVIDGQAKAYSLNLLNHHEIVNDRTGNVAFAAVW